MLTKTLQSRVFACLCMCVCVCVCVCVNGLLIQNCKIGYIIYDQLILVEFVDLQLEVVQSNLKICGPDKQTMNCVIKRIVFKYKPQPLITNDTDM